MDNIYTPMIDPEFCCHMLSMDLMLKSTAQRNKAMRPKL